MHASLFNGGVSLRSVPRSISPFPSPSSSNPTVSGMKQPQREQQQQQQHQQQQQQQQQLSEHALQQQQQMLGRGLVNTGFMSGQQATAAAAAAQQVSIKQEAGDPATAGNAGPPQMAGGGFVDSTTRQQGHNLADNAALSDMFQLQENLKTGTWAFLLTFSYSTLPSYSLHESRTVYPHKDMFDHPMKCSHQSKVHVVPSLSDPDRISNLLADSVLEAHTRTSLMPREQIREEWRKGIDRNRLFALKNMVRRNENDCFERVQEMIHLSISVLRGPVDGVGTKTDDGHYADH